MEIDLNINVKQVLQMYDHDKDTYTFLVEKDGKWVEITKEQYKKLLEVDNG